MLSHKDGKVEVYGSFPTQHQDFYSTPPTANYAQYNKSQFSSRI